MWWFFQPQMVAYNHQFVIYNQKINPATYVDWVYFIVKLIRLKVALIKLYWCQRVYARFPLNGVCEYVWFLG